MSEAMLDIQQLHFSYQTGPPLFQGIDLHISPAEFIGIIGPNGAGKSTLIKLIGGLLEPGQGHILLDQKAIQAYPKKELARMIGYVPQSVDLAFDFIVHEVVKMGRYPYLRGMLHEDNGDQAEVASALQRMDLQGLQNRPFSALSGGEKQRVIIASVLAQQANILLLDEPTSSLDLKHQQSIYRILKKLSREERKTIIIVTHDINLAAQFCERLILLDKGAVLADGPPDQVLQFQLIQKVYGVKVYIDVNPFTKSLYIIPFDTQ
jgi:iron complex transport system ATP-binding protein